MIDVRKTRGDAGFYTYRVSVDGTSVGFVRSSVTYDRTNPNTRQWFYSLAPVGGFDSPMAHTRTVAVNNLLYSLDITERIQRQNRQGGKRAPKLRPMPDGVPDEGTPTDIKCACGHTYRFRIRRTSAVEWLQGRPCPDCQHGRTPDATPDNDQEPTPEPTPEPDDERVAEILAGWAATLTEAQHEALTDLTLLVSRGLPVWMQGPPGTGKSTLAEQAARALGLSFHPVSCHELMSDSHLFGYRDATGTIHKTPLWEAYEDGGLCLLDEVDNGNPNLLAALNSALSNGHCVFAGQVVTRHPDFRVVATANTDGLGPTAGFVGRAGVDLATRDRFVTLMVPIDHVLEISVAAYALGDAPAYDAAMADSITRANRNRTERAKITLRNAGTVPADVVAAVETVRGRIDDRFKGSVVSPRTSAHVSTMLTVGWSLTDALAAKLVGLTPTEVASVTDGVGR